MSSLRRLLIAISAVALVVLATGCGTHTGGSGDKDNQATLPPGSDATKNADVARSFFEAVASNDADALDDALEYAAPRSLAAGYLTYLGDAATAFADGGEKRPADALTKDPAGYRICHAESDACVQYGAVVLTDGKVSSFNVDGDQIGKRTALGTGKPAPLGELGTVEFLNRSANSSTDLLFINLHLTSGDVPITLESATATYRTEHGEQFAISTVYGPDHLDAKSEANVLLVVHGAKAGPGSLDYAVKDADGNEKAITLRTY